jgi:branched-subunit amino acid transport protein
MLSLWILIVAMGLVTYLPRMLPMVLLQNLQLPTFLNRFLRYIPFAALGALIFPGIVSSTGNTSSAVLGMVVSVILAYFRLHLLLIVFGGIFTAFFVEYSHISLPFL